MGHTWKDNHTMKNWEEDIREQFRNTCPYAPIIFVSALTKQRPTNFWDDQANQWKSKYTYSISVLNDVIMDAIAINSNTDRQRETS